MKGSIVLSKLPSNKDTKKIYSSDCGNGQTLIICPFNFSDGSHGFEIRKCRGGIEITGEGYLVPTEEKRSEISRFNHEFRDVKIIRFLEYPDKYNNEIKISVDFFVESLGNIPDKEIVEKLKDELKTLFHEKYFKVTKYNKQNFPQQ